MMSRSVVVGGCKAGCRLLTSLFSCWICIAFPYGVFCVLLYGQKDPAQFGSLPSALLTLFRMATLDDWTSTIIPSFGGCNESVPTNYIETAGYGTFYDFAEEDCATQDAVTRVGTFIFFLTYMVLVPCSLGSLLLGAVGTAMMEALDAAGKNNGASQRTSAKGPRWRRCSWRWCGWSNACILVCAAVAGLETSHGWRALILLRIATSLFFLSEALFFLSTLGGRKFFSDPWHCADVAILLGEATTVALSITYRVVPGLGVISILRLARLVRSFTLLPSYYPELQCAALALIGAMGGIVRWVIGAIILASCLLGACGMLLLNEADPWRFSTFYMASLTVFQCFTLDGWGGSMLASMYGCEHFDQGLDLICDNPRPKGWAAAAFYIVCALCALLFFALFAGAAFCAFDRAKRKLRAGAAASLERVALELRVDESRLEKHRELVMELDVRKTGQLPRQQVCAHLLLSNTDTTLLSEEDADRAFSMVAGDGSETIDASSLLRLVVFFEEARRQEEALASFCHADTVAAADPGEGLGDNGRPTETKPDLDNENPAIFASAEPVSDLTLDVSIGPDENFLQSREMRDQIEHEVSAIEETIRSGEMSIPEAAEIVEEAVNEGDYTSSEANEIWSLLCSRLSRFRDDEEVTSFDSGSAVPWLAPRGKTPPLRRRVQASVLLVQQQQSSSSSLTETDNLRPTLAALLEEEQRLEEDTQSLRSLHRALESSAIASQARIAERTAAENEMARSQELLRQKLALQEIAAAEAAQAAAQAAAEAAAEAAARPADNQRPAGDDALALREQHLLEVRKLRMDAKATHLRAALEARRRRLEKYVHTAFARIYTFAAQRNELLVSADDVRVQRARWVSAQMGRRADRMLSRALRIWAAAAAAAAAAAKAKAAATTIAESGSASPPEESSRSDAKLAAAAAAKKVWSQASEAIRVANAATTAADERAAEAERRMKAAEEAALAKNKALEELRAAFDRKLSEATSQAMSEQDLESLMEAKRPRAYQRMVKMKENEAQQAMSANGDTQAADPPGNSRSAQSVTPTSQRIRSKKKRDKPPPPRLGKFRERLRKRNEMRVKAGFHAARSMLRASSGSFG